MKGMFNVSDNYTVSAKMKIIDRWEHERTNSNEKASDMIANEKMDMENITEVCEGF